MDHLITAVITIAAMLFIGICVLYPIVFVVITIGGFLSSIILAAYHIIHTAVVDYLNERKQK